MVTQQLVAFIAEEMKKGKTRADLEKELFLNGGWSASDLDQAFKALETPTGPSITALPKVHKKVRLLYVIILMLIAGYIGWWIRDRQQFLQIPIPFVRQ